MAVPGVPVNVNVVPSVTSADIGWTAPASDGGSAITDYEVRHKLSTASDWGEWVSGGTDLMESISGLLSDTAYDFELRAENADGYSSVISSSFTTLIAPPSSLVVTPGDAQVELVWHPSVTTGITAYEVRISPVPGDYGGWSNQGLHTSYVERFLINGSVYKFQVRAVKGDLVSLPIESSEVTPVSGDALPVIPDTSYVQSYTLTDDELKEIRYHVGNRVSDTDLPDEVINSQSVLGASLDFVLSMIRKSIDMTKLPDLSADERDALVHLPDEGPQDIARFVNIVLKGPQQRQFRRAVIYRCAGIALTAIARSTGDSFTGFSTRVAQTPLQFQQQHLFLLSATEVVLIREQFPDDVFLDREQEVKAGHAKITMFTTTGGA